MLIVDKIDGETNTSDMGTTNLDEKFSNLCWTDCQSTCQGLFPSIKNESWGTEDAQIPTKSSISLSISLRKIHKLLIPCRPPNAPVYSFRTPLCPLDTRTF